MGPVVGQSAKYMTAKRPEGTLSNLLADILVWGAKNYQEQVDFGIYNMGGVRADLPKGTITYGDVVDIAPFENKIAFTTLSGADVLELFEQIAAVGGEGVSRGVRLVIKKDAATSKYTLESATINGEPVDPQRDYRITTIDYLLGGTDKMGAFKKGRNVNSPQDASNNSRFVIMNYFLEQQKLGKIVDSEIEGRITVK
jgi:2',3'-cyclic-nucleotide 2'-phosphodiesterase (5'-nucleotidase family)